MKKLLSIGLVILLAGCDIMVKIPENFEDCVALGNPIMESSPRQCSHEGRTFVEGLEVNTGTGDDVVGEDLGMTNPASEYCKEKGGQVDIREDESGGQYGVCMFEDGSECEEWAFMRKACVPSVNGMTEIDNDEDIDVEITDIEICEGSGSDCVK